MRVGTRRRVAHRYMKQRSVSAPAQARLVKPQRGSQQASQVRRPNTRTRFIHSTRATCKRIDLTHYCERILVGSDGRGVRPGPPKTTW